jgi:hypothetical protein
LDPKLCHLGVEFYMGFVDLVFFLDILELSTGVLRP